MLKNSSENQTALFKIFDFQKGKKNIKDLLRKIGPILQHWTAL